jgi:hypothetical protein
MQNSAKAAAAKGDADPPSIPTRGVERVKSGVGRKAPGRSKSHKIGRPTFSTELPPEPQRGVNRNKSGRLRSTPSRSLSSGKNVPERSGSTGSLKAHRKQQQPGGTPATNEIDDISVSDSVFTSASNQTLDSIMLRKKQFGPGDAKPGGMRMPSRSEEDTDFDDESLHTVDSIMMHHRHVDNGGDDDEQGDMSVFSESFASSATYDDFSDYDELEGGADVREVEFEEDFELDDEQQKSKQKDAEESLKELTLVDE